jgi:hypothetical protein
VVADGDDLVRFGSIRVNRHTDFEDLDQPTGWPTKAAVVSLALLLVDGLLVAGLIQWRGWLRASAVFLALAALLMTMVALFVLSVELARRRHAREWAQQRDEYYRPLRDAAARDPQKAAELIELLDRLRLPTPDGVRLPPQQGRLQAGPDGLPSVAVAGQPPAKRSRRAVMGQSIACDTPTLPDGPLQARLNGGAAEGRLDLLLELSE